MRSYDVVLYGATGFTGRQTASYFAEHAPGSVKWALAGRNRAKLERVRGDLRYRGSAADIVVADSSQPETVAAMAADTRVVLTTAGPFALYGEPVVRACAESGTHYVDITGETHWVRRMIDRYESKASASGTRLIPFCGFDSVPSDLGVWMMVQAVRERWGEGTREVRAAFSAKGGVNGGTLATALNTYASGQASNVRDPHLLTPEIYCSAEARAANPDLHWPTWDEDLGLYLAPFVMAVVNTRVVRRSEALFRLWGETYGPDFRYIEAMAMKRWATAQLVALGMLTAQGALSTAPGRALIRKLAPDPGQGPSEEAMDGGFHKTRLIAVSESGHKLRGLITGEGDPGNRSTVRMLCESALALALDEDELPGGSGRGGFLTPATGLGEVLLRRLKATGKMRWETSAV